MIDDESFPATLQIADSALPIGRFVHSYGLEAWLRDREPVPASTIVELVESVVCEAVAPLDGALVAHAQRPTTVAELAALDRVLTARKLAPAAREASTRCGPQLCALAVSLTDDSLVAAFAAGVSDGETDGNLAVIEGTLARALGLSALAAVLVELRGAAASFLSAAVRLDALTALRAQVALRAIAPALADAARAAVALSLDQLSATAPELEIASLAHRRADARMFAT